MGNATAKTIAELLKKRVFCYLRVPERIHTNQGAQFKSRLMAESTLYHSQANGVAERGNRDLGDMLRSMLLGRDEVN